jgi:lysine 2,3-aminomutase
MEVTTSKKKSEAIEIHPLKPPVDPAVMTHRALLDGPFWQRIPAYRTVTEDEFLDHRFQMKHTITRPDKLLATVQDL